MSQARKIVLEDYPVDKLPADFNVDKTLGDRVRITIEQAGDHEWTPLLERIRRYHRENPGQSITTEEAVNRVRELRDEWG